MYYKLNIEFCSSQNNYVYPQVEHMGANYNWDSPNAITQIITNQPLQFSPNMQSFYLSDLTIRTDIVTQGYIYRMGFLASVRFCNYLTQFVLQPYEFWPAEVIYHSHVFNYKWIHMIEEMEKYIDYTMSEFIIQKQDGVEINIEIPTREIFERKSFELINSGIGILKAKKIVFISGVKHFDFFGLTLNGHEFFISDRLAKKLKEQQFTGFKIETSPYALIFQS